MFSFQPFQYHYLKYILMLLNKYLYPFLKQKKKQPLFDLKLITYIN